MKSSCKIGFIGTGNMAQAILFGIVKHNTVPPQNIYAYDILPETLEKVCAKSGINPASSNIDVVEKCDMIVLAVKPHFCEGVLKEVGQSLKDKALMSIVSGWALEDIKTHVADTCRIQVVQPNTPLLVGAGMTMLAKTTTFKESELELVRSIFQPLGLVQVIPDELLMFCGTSGGAAPAFTYMFIEALADASVQDGIPRDIAYKICAQAVVGAGKMVLETGMHPGALKDQICSPGGSTIRGVHALERGGMRGTVMDAVKAANDRWRKV